MLFAKLSFFSSFSINMDDDLDSPPRHVGLRDSETKDIVRNTTKYIKLDELGFQKT